LLRSLHSAFAHEYCDVFQQISWYFFRLNDDQLMNLLLKSQNTSIIGETHLVCAMSHKGETVSKGISSQAIKHLRITPQGRYMCYTHFSIAKPRDLNINSLPVEFHYER
jgi:hypothetical protein